MTTKMHKFGQYFTKNDYLKGCVYKLIRNNPTTILEPSMGRGDLVDHVLNKSPNTQFDLYEIDTNIEPLNTINKDAIVFTDFMTCDITDTYNTIIGNPPFVRTKTGNLYIDFVEKCVKLLNENGELIFIVPSDFLKLTSASNVLNNMMKQGTFTDVIYPHNETLFEHASIDVIIFRYCKNTNLSNVTFVNDKKMYIVNTNGIITFSKNKTLRKNKISDFFNVHVGMVTGRESVLKNKEYGNIELLNNKREKHKYILIQKFPTKNKKLNKYMLDKKEVLLGRRIRKFNESNWFEWGALRNYKTITELIGKDCIYMCNLTRNKQVAFTGKVTYFGGDLIILIPKKKCDLNKIVAFFNSNEFKQNYTYSNRFKIGHRQVSNILFDLF
jgi:adenine-specific DNA-methyltransferase